MCVCESVCEEEYYKSWWELRQLTFALTGGDMFNKNKCSNYLILLKYFLYKNGVFV